MNLSKLIQSRFITILILILFSISLTAQIQTDANISFVNQNVWRGVYQAGVSMQPEVNLGYKDWNFQVWGTSDFNAEEKEIDLSIGYSLRNFNIGLTDYWIGGITDAYSKNHVLENNLSYTFPNIPLSIEWNTVLIGYDKNFPVFQHISYSPEWRGCQYEFSMGYSPWKNDLLGCKGFAVNELSISMSKEIKITHNSSLCSGFYLIYNPSSDKLFFVCKIGIPLSF